MAELLIVVAIIIILAGVSFIAVQIYQKSVTQSQYDTIAKEIFVAAQNHLTMAKSENYRQKSDLAAAKTGGFFGAKGTAVDDGTSTDIFYVCSKDTPIPGVLDQMLPFGAVELVSGGNYIIRYQPGAAKVLDVFYWTDGSGRFDANISSSEYKDLVENYREDKHKSYKTGLIGWFGGEGIEKSGALLDAPSIKVINDALLLVEVTDTNSGINTSNEKKALKPQLKLIVTGEKSGAKVAIPLSTAIPHKRCKEGSTDLNSKKVSVVLDDITTVGMHFSDINSDIDLKKAGSFIPGENIIIQAVAYSNTALTNVAYSGEWTTNSLFGEMSVTKTSETVAGTVQTNIVAKEIQINNIRHLENLNDSLSQAGYDKLFPDQPVNAVQTADLDWNEFKTRANTLKGYSVETGISIYQGDASAKQNCYLPVTVSNSYRLNYNGQNEVEITETTGEGSITTTPAVTVIENHSIKNVVVDNDSEGSISLTDAGVFGSLKNAAISNLELIDANIKMTSGNAGILAGSLADNSTVENVIAYHTKTSSLPAVSASKDAGGLIGSMSGTTSVTKCAASVIVESTGGNAGGLIGSSTVGSVTGSYSGGHTIDDSTGAVIYDPEQYNVTAEAGNAGGLIGNAGSTEIKYSYSTCSANGKTAGGLVGNASGNIRYSYCTGLVEGATEGAFAGTYTGTATECKYFEIVNEREERDSETSLTSYTYLPAVSGGTAGTNESESGIKPFDETAAAYDRYASTPWADARPYNNTLTKYYGEDSGESRDSKYLFRTVAQLGALADDTAFSVRSEPKDSDTDQTPADYVIQHYGDWPVPEIFVINTPGSN